MIGQYPIVSFDTSAHNRLVKDGALSEPIFAGLGSGMFFRFAGLSIEEMFAHPKAPDRVALFDACRRLQKGPSECIYPHNEIIRRLAVDHCKNPAGFNWKTVNVRDVECEKEIQRPRLIADEQLSTDQRNAQFQGAKDYEHIFSADLRIKIDRVFASHKEAPPATYLQAVTRAKNGTPNLVTAIGKRLYDRAAETNASEATIEAFVDVCPPFHASIYALLMTWYHRCVRHPHAGERFTAGRNDLLMSAHLPYCDKFVTADGEQAKCLREIVAVAGLDTEVLSYDDFCDSFLVGV